MIYGSYALTVTFGVLWLLGWKEPLSNSVFRAAGAGHLGLLQAHVLGAILSVLVPCTPILIWSFFACRRFTMKRVLMSVIVGVFLIGMIGYNRGGNWQLAFIDGVQSRLAQVASPADWQQWARAQLDNREDGTSGRIPASEVPAFVNEAYPQNMALCAWRQSSVTRTERVSVIWRGQFASWGIRVEFGKPSKITEHADLYHSQQWTNGLIVFLSFE